MLVRAREASGEVLGATVVANRAGEIVNELTLAIKAGLGLEVPRGRDGVSHKIDCLAAFTTKVTATV